MNTDRKAKLEKALAPMLPNDRIRFADMAYGIQCHADRLSTLHAALIEAVEALDFAYKHSNEPVIFNKALEALSKIDKALEEK